jgi:hypothetical protein
MQEEKEIVSFEDTETQDVVELTEVLSNGTIEDIVTSKSNSVIGPVSKIENLGDRLNFSLKDGTKKMSFMYISSKDSIDIAYDGVVIATLTKDRPPISSKTPSQNDDLVNKQYADDTFEPKLGKPGTDDMLLSSKSDGTRSWVTKRDGVVWQGVWQSKEYVKNDMVRDGTFVMIANKTTSDKAGPVKAGDPFYYGKGATSVVDATETASQILFGNRLTLESYCYVDGVKINAKSGVTYELLLVANPGGNEETRSLLTFTASEDGVKTIDIPRYFFSKGTKVDILARIVSGTSSSVVTAEYTYIWDREDIAPESGHINHSSNSPGKMSISKTDANGNDIGSSLLSLTIGDTIVGNGMTWTIQSAPTDSGTYVLFEVYPDKLGEKDNVVASFDFNSTTDADITYSKQDGFWASGADYNGLFIANGSYSDIVANDNYYDVDLLIQNISLSPDWDIVSLT